jgi:hypothetical protein
VFRYKKGIKLGYDRQIYVYAISRSFYLQPECRRNDIIGLCRNSAGDNWEALLEFVTTDDSATAICMRHYIASRTTLYRAAKKYYESFPAI